MTIITPLPKKCLPSPVTLSLLAISSTSKKADSSVRPKWIPPLERTEYLPMEREKLWERLFEPDF